MTLYVILGVLATIGFGSFAAAEYLLYRRLRSEDLIDRIAEYGYHA